MLTERELRVARLIVRGLTNEEIAEAMLLSVSTIKQYVRNIRSKLGVRTKREIPDAMRRFGIE